MAIPHLKLLYLPVRARAESIRMILHYRRVPFTDTTLSFGEFFKLSESLPYEQLPVLEVGTNENKVVLAQSGSILRYLGRILTLAPTTPLAAAQHDSIFETAQEMTQTMSRRPGLPPLPSVSRIANWTQGAEQEKYIEQLLSPTYLPHYARVLTRALSAAPFFGGDSPLYADFGVLHVLDMCDTLRPGSVHALSAPLGLWMDRMRALPGVCEYLAARPDIQSLGIFRQKDTKKDKA